MKKETKFTEEEEKILRYCSTDLEHADYFEYNGFFGGSEHFKTIDDLKNVANDLKCLASKYQDIAEILDKILEKHKKS